VEEAQAMCGRFTNRYTWGEMVQLYRISEPSTMPTSSFQPRYNIAPTQSGYIVRLKAGSREFAFPSWGLVPSVAKDKNDAAKMANAKAETIEKPAYRSAFRHRRCLVVADGYYEWAKITSKEKQPYFVTTKNSSPFAFAGIWEWWVPREGPRFESFAIITCTPNSLMAPLHDRMPVMLSPDAWPSWLGEQLMSPEKLKTLLKPFPPERMECWPVGKEVDEVSNDEPRLIERVDTR
jgi:putative SOS response-associated peptidase YedK